MIMDTEEKIKEAARKIFKQKGYAGTRTRDIADAAGVNPALLNYYFRSKEGLFKEIMKDVMRDFISTARPILEDRSKSFKEAIVDFINRVVDLYLDEPDLVIFIINELRSMPKQLIKELNISEVIKETIAYDFFLENFAGDDMRTSMQKGVMFVVSCMSFILFPFIIKPALANLADVSDEEFRSLMDERRKMIPAWRDFMFEQYGIKAE